VSQYQRQEAIDALGKKVHLILKDGVVIFEFDKMYIAEAMIIVFQDLEKIRTERDALRDEVNKRVITLRELYAERDELLIDGQIALSNLADIQTENARLRADLARQHDAEKRRALVPVWVHDVEDFYDDENEPAAPFPALVDVGQGEE
jgi:hypothetical protein